MAKANVELMNKRLSSIQRGAYYFGIIGRLSIVLGLISIVLSLATYGLTGEASASLLSAEGTEMLLGAGSSILYGWLFLIGRDAFEAIGAMIREMNEIV